MLKTNKITYEKRGVTSSPSFVDSFLFLKSMVLIGQHSEMFSSLFWHVSLYAVFASFRSTNYLEISLGLFRVGIEAIF